VLLLVLAAGAGCADRATLRADATLPLEARAEPRGYIVVTVRNQVLSLSRRAASTAHGYDGQGPYFAGSPARLTARALAHDYHLALASSWPIAILGVHCLVYAVPTGVDSASLLSALTRDRRVESAQQLLSFDTQSDPYNDPYAPLQQNLQRLGVSAAQRLSRGAGVRVAVIDTGADTAHPDLRPHAASERNFVDTDDRAFRADAHGTAIAGVIAAVPNNHIGIVGIAPDVQLLSYKACWRIASGDTHAVCNTFTLAQALAAAIDASADVINLSLAGPADPLLTRLVQRALAAGEIVVGAVPPGERRGTFPAGIGGVIGVEAVEASDAVEDETSLTATVRAPGRDVLSLAPDGHYDFYSGSSLATAEISGIVALLRAGHPHLSGNEATSLLFHSTPVASRSPGGPVPDACVALRTLLHGGECSQDR
jgi:subtilisin family serine protease